MVSSQVVPYVNHRLCANVFPRVVQRYMRLLQLGKKPIIYLSKKKEAHNLCMWEGRVNKKIVFSNICGKLKNR